MPVDKHWSDYSLETKEGGNLTLNSDQQFNVYSNADSSIDISNGDFTLEVPDGSLTIGISNGGYSAEALKLQAHGGSLRMSYNDVGCRFAYTGYSHYFSASNQNEEGYRFTYAHNDEDTENAFIITRSDGGAPKFIMNNNGRIEYEGTFRLSGSGGPGDGKFLVSDAQGDATWQEFEDVVDLDHLQNESYLQGGTIEIQENVFRIDGMNAIDPGSGDGFIHLRSASSVQLQFTSTGTESGSTYLWLQDDHQCKVQGPGISMDEGLLLVECNSTSTDQIAIEVELSSSAAHGSQWIQFQDSANNVKGAVEMVGSSSDAHALKAWPSYGNPSGIAATWMYADYLPTVDAVTTTGNARFVSGNADFGEFFESGDTGAWGIEPQDFSKSTKKADILGLPEGLVVWVRDGKFYQNMINNNCIPMFVTKRSIITGDGAALLGSLEKKKTGEVLSFCGKLPVLIKGAVSCGDYIVPKDGENYCYAVKYDDISFGQYKKAMGRALGECDEIKVLSEEHPHDPGQETAFSKVLCAVGIK